MYDECGILSELRKAIEEYKTDTGKTKQLSLDMDPKKEIEEFKVLRDQKIKEIHGIMRERDNCLKKRVFQAMKLGQELFKD
jgi:hypothetical protein